MILTNAYFIDEIFIPHASPSITDEITAIGSDMIQFIETYEQECLIKCLGYSLYKELQNVLDSSKPNGLKDETNAKWDKLLNGHEYTNSDDELIRWRGIRWKSGATYNKSFLAEYVYYAYEKSNDDDRVGVGNVKQEAANSMLVSKTPKVIAAWRRFFEAVQGGCYEPQFISNSFGNGVDWFGSNSEKTLYSFIQDMNYIDSTTYPNFKPFAFKNANQFGI